MRNSVCAAGGLARFPIMIGQLVTCFHFPSSSPNPCAHHAQGHCCPVQLLRPHIVMPGLGPLLSGLFLPPLVLQHARSRPSGSPPEARMPTARCFVAEPLEVAR